MTNQKTSVVRRISADKDIVLKFIETQNDWIPITALNKVVEASPLYQKYRQQYELARD